MRYVREQHKESNNHVVSSRKENVMKKGTALFIGTLAIFAMLLVSFISVSAQDKSEVADYSKSNNKVCRFIERHDLDKDGQVSRDEFKGPEEHFTHFDKNNDGYISAEEAPTGPPPERMGKNREMNRERGMNGRNMNGKGTCRKDFIADFDKNNDGKVSKDEFPGPEEHFTRLDTDQDGYLSAEEAPKGPPAHKRGMRNQDKEEASIM